MSEPDNIPDPAALIRHGKSVRALASAILGDPSAADDIAQEAYLAALRDGGVPVRDTGAWLRGVGRNLARRWIRTESRRRHREEVRPLPDAPASPEETAARLETESALTDSVRALAEPYRTVVVLRYLDGLTTAETAARTRVPESTVKTRLRRALTMLRDALDGRYGARSAWLPLLVRIARPMDPTPAATAAVGTATLVAGGLVMAKKLLIVTVFAAVLAAVFVAPIVWDDLAPEPSPDGVPEEPSVIANGPAVPEDTTMADDSAGGTAATAGSAAAPFRVVVHAPDGSSVDGARVRLVGGDGKPAGEAVTGPDGVATLRATGESGVVHVRAKSAARESREVEAIAGTGVDVHLKLGSVISGTLYFGEERAAGVEVHLNPLEDLSRSLVAVTDARGGFAFTGLAPGARFSFFAGWDVHFVEPEGERNVALTAPAADLAIRAVRDPRVRGIVVHSDGSPVRGAVVELECRRTDGAGSSRRATAGADGRFEVSVHGGREGIETLTLTATEPESAGREVIDVKPDLLRDGEHDLGRIILRDPRTFEFEVRGADGKPVPGAVVLPTDDRSRMSPPTDGSGITKYDFAPGTTSVQVGAPGEGTVVLRLPEEATGPIPVALPGGTLLTLRIRTKTGQPPVLVAVLLEADTRLLDVPEGMSERVYGRKGISRPVSSSVSETESHLTFRVPKDGVLRIAGIRAGVSFRVRIVDHLTEAELDRRELRLRTRERREVDIPLAVANHTLVLHVRDGAGQPLAGARITAEIGDGALLARTGASGIGVLPGIRGETVRVTIEKRGSAPFVGSYAVEDLSKPIPVVLSAGRTIRLTVLDASGSPVACEEAEATATGLDYRFEGYEVDPGVYLFKDLPAGRVRVAVRYAGALQEATVDAASDQAQVTVPATGSVIVRFEGRLERPLLHLMRLTPTSGSTGTEVAVDVNYLPKRKQWEVRLPRVLPGSYRVSLESYGDRDENGEFTYQPYRTGPTIQVEAGRETTTNLPRR